MIDTNYSAKLVELALQLNGIVPAKEELHEYGAPHTFDRYCGIVEEYWHVDFEKRSINMEVQYLPLTTAELLVVEERFFPWADAQIRKMHAAVQAAADRLRAEGGQPMSAFVPYAWRVYKHSQLANLSIHYCEGNDYQVISRPGLGGSQIIEI